jgi:hypothetical protein
LPWFDITVQKGTRQPPAHLTENQKACSIQVSETSKVHKRRIISSNQLDKVCSKPCVFMRSMFITVVALMVDQPLL